MGLEALQICRLNHICHIEHSLLKYLRLTKAISFYVAIYHHVG